MSTTTQPVPQKIKLAGGNNSITVEWSDGHESAFPYLYLREHCPCATCAELHPSPAVAPSPLPMLGSKPLRPLRAQVVGRYALQIFWNDGHSTGIYSFEYLRGLCPCAECSVK